MTHNSWGQPPQPHQPFQQQPYPQPSFGPPNPPGPPGSAAAPAKSDSAKRVFPIGMAVVALLTFASSFLHAVKASATLEGTWVVETRNLWGLRKVSSSDGTSITGFDTSLLLRGVFINQWIVLPIASAVILGGLVISVVLARRGRGWWATPVVALVASLTQLFWAIHLATFSTRMFFNDVSVQQRVDQYGVQDRAVGAGTWCWILLGLTGATLSIAELVRAKRAGTASELWKSDATQQSKHWSLMGASIVLTVIFGVFAHKPITRFGVVTESAFYAFSFWGFLALVALAAVLGAVKRWRAAWVCAAVAFSWQFAWFFVCALQSENQLWAYFKAASVVWIVTSLVGAVIAGIGLYTTAQHNAAPQQPVPAPNSGFGGPHSGFGAPHPGFGGPQPGFGGPYPPAPTHP